MFVQNFLLEVKISFRALQTDSDFVSEQYENFLNQLLQLQENFRSERDESLDITSLLAFAGDYFTAGQFMVTSSGVQKVVHGIDVYSVDLATQLDYKQTERVFRAFGVLRVAEMNGSVKILAGKQSVRQEVLDASPPCLPLDLIETSLA